MERNALHHRLGNNRDHANNEDDEVPDRLADHNHDEVDHLRSLDQVLEEASSRTSNTISLDPSEESSTRCFPYSLEAWRYWRIFVALGICNASDASEILCLAYVLANGPFQMQMLNSTAWRASLLASLVFAGMLMGGLLVALVGDSSHATCSKRGGRRGVLLQGLTLNAISGILAALVAPNVGWLCVFRFLGGVGIGSSIPPMFTLCAELAPARDRGFWGSWVASFWLVGSLFVALVAWPVLGTSKFWWWEHHDHSYAWRVLILICTFPSVLGLTLVRLFVPESPRYLALHGQPQEAVEVVHHITTHCLQSSCRPWTLEEAMHHYVIPSSSSSLLDSTASLDAGNDHIRTRTVGMAGVLGSLVVLYDTPRLKGTTWALQGIWFSLSFASYGLSTWINTLFVQVQLQNIYWNALLFAASSFPGNILSTILLDRWGRKTVLVTSLLASTLSLLLFAYIVHVVAHQQDSSNASAEDSSSATSSSSSFIFLKRWIVGSACAFQCCTIIAWNTLAVVTPELYPTMVRNSGTALCGASGRVGAMVAQITNGFTVHKPALLLTISAATLLFGTVVPFGLPDKTRQGVEDRIQIATLSTSEDGGPDEEPDTMVTEEDQNHNSATLDLHHTPDSYQQSRQIVS